jgi:hypothetical protein
VLELFIHTLYFSVNLSNYFNSDSSPMTLQSVGICVSEYRFMQLLLFLTRPTVCVTGAGAGVDSAWEQEKLEARKMLENAAESPASSARCVGRFNFLLRLL